MTRPKHPCRFFSAAIFGIGLSLSTTVFSQPVSSPKLDIPQRKQIGATCGLYALGMAMDYWHSVDLKNPTYWVSDLDRKGQGVQYNYTPTSSERILDYVKDSGYSSAGEMYDAELLAKTAIHFGYHAVLYRPATLSDIYRALDQKHPILVAFDVSDPIGDIGHSHGMRAHYAVLEGYYDDHGVRYVIAKHGWGMRADYTWNASELFESMNNLLYTDYYSTQPKLPRALKLSTYLQSKELKDISKSLKNAAIEIFPIN